MLYEHLTSYLEAVISVFDHLERASEFCPTVNYSLLDFDFFPICYHFQDDLIRYSTYPGKPIASLCLCEAA